MTSTEPSYDSLPETTPGTVDWQTDLEILDRICQSMEESMANLDEQIDAQDKMIRELLSKTADREV